MSIMYGRLALCKAKIGGAVNRAFSSSKERSCFSVGLCQSLPAFFRSKKGACDLGVILHETSIDVACA